MKRFKVSYDETVIQGVAFEIEAESIEYARDHWRTMDWKNIEIVLEVASLGMIDNTKSIMEISNE